MAETEKDVAAEARDQHLTDTYGDADPVSEATVVVTAHHVPGAPLERKADGESSRAYEAELAEVTADVAVNEHVVEYDGVDTRTAEANLASRSNIVSDGPGTAGAVGSLGVGPA